MIRYYTFEDRDGRKCPLDFTIRGYGYSKKKDSARKLAETVKKALAEYRFSYLHKAMIAETMEEIGSRFGLLTEFRESGIC